MTEAIRLPGVTDEINHTLNALICELDAKQPRNFLRASYYDGKRAIRQVGTVIPPQYYRLGIVLGWSAKAIDTLARSINLDGFEWSDGDLDALGMREVSESNDLRTEMSSAMISSLIHGVSFLVNTRGDESAGEPAALIHVKDAMSATGHWNPRKRHLDNLLSITGRDKEGKPTSLALYLDGLTVTAERDGSGWSVDQSEHPWGVPAEPLVYRPRAGRPFGSSRISRAVMSLQDQGLREVIRLEAHMDIYSIPELIMLGADGSIFKNADGTPKADWQVMLGRVKGIPDDEDATNPRADVKQFAASSPAPHLSALNAFAKMFAREVSLPDSDLAIGEVSNPASAEAMLASKDALNAEAEGAQDDWSPAIRRTTLRALAQANGLDAIPPEWVSIEADWRDVRYPSRASQADAGMKQLAAVPWLAETEIGLELLGLDAPQIRRALAEKRKLGGSAALRAITEAAAANRPAVTSVDAGANPGA